MAAAIETVKLTPALRAVTNGRLDVPVSQVTLSAVPRLWSSVTWISLLAVTAVVSTTTEVELAAITKRPAAAEPQTEGEVELAQFVAVW